MTEAEKYRRELIKIGLTTQDRHTFNRVVDVLGIKSADSLYKLARREGVVA